MILLLSILVLILSTYLFKKAAGSLNIRHINIISYTYYTLIIWVFIGSVLLYYRIGNVTQNVTQVSDNPLIRLYGWIGIMYMMIAVPLAMNCINILFSIKPRQTIIKYYLTPLRTFFKINDIAIKYVLYIISISAAIVLIVEVIPRLSTIPFYNRFLSELSYTSVELYQQRNDTRLFGASSIFAAMFISLIPLCTYMSFSYWLLSKQKIDLCWFMLLLIVNVFLQIFDLAKGRIFFFAIGMIMVYLMSGGTIKVRTLLIYLFIGIVGVGFTYVFFMGATVENVGVVSLFNLALNSMFGRIFMGQIMGYYECLEIFPSSIQFIGFSSTGRLIHDYLGMQYNPDYGLVLRHAFNPTESGSMGHFTTFFMGEAWANFGFIGIVLAPVLVGITLQSVHIFFMRSHKSPFHISFYTTMILAMPILTGFRGFYYPMWVLQKLFFAFAIIGFALLLRGATNSKLRK